MELLGFVFNGELTIPFFDPLKEAGFLQGKKIIDFFFHCMFLNITIPSEQKKLYQYIDW